MTEAEGAGRVLPLDFYLRDTRDVARELLGKELVNVTAEGKAAGIIVETEAYMGVDDRACHAFGGRLSRRTAVMYEEGGRAYIYLIYGMYWCLNVVTRGPGMPEAVLIRAIEPIFGVELMRRRRKNEKIKTSHLGNGPGKLCLAMGIDGSLYGEDLCGDRLFIRKAKTVLPEEIALSPRINIDYAGDAVHHHWRYYVRGNPCVSRV